MEGIEYDRGVGGSRITRVLGKMIRMLAERVQDRLAEALAGELGHPPELVTRQFGGGFLTPDGRLHTLAQAASLVPGGVDELLRYQLVPEDVCEAYGAVAAEVAVDGETGGVRVRRLVTALEVGKIVNPIMHQGQIDGGLIQGLGYALGEGLVFDEGRVVNANLGDYKLPVGPDVPDLETILLPAEPRLGITPIGEGPNYGASAAIVNAIMDVVGRQVEIPVSPEAIAGLDSAAASRTSAPPASGSA
jgi:CO/xanthine dehydrogenase Mo-binding subunit